jgi:formyl-CoA transferase
MKKEAGNYGKPLEGLRILDLGNGIAGPYAATILADFGAEVIKIEDPKGGDQLRQQGPFYQQLSLNWLVLGRNKKSITLDITTPQGQKIIRDLVSYSDVLIENYLPGTLEQWGLGYEALKEINPGLIMLRVSLAGQDGPYKSLPPLEPLGAALGGLSYLTGDPDGPPMRCGIPITEYLTSLIGALAIMMALYHRDIKQTGEGQWIDLTLSECLYRLSEFNISAFHLLNSVRKRIGNKHPSAAPLDNFPTKDNKWIVLLISGSKHFVRLAHAMEQEHLKDDPRFAKTENRVKNAALINQIVAEWISNHTQQEVIDRLEEYGVAVGPIFSVQDMLTDPNYQARENIVEVPDSRIGKVKMHGVVPKFSLTPGSIEWAGPDLGQHNKEVLQELLGYDQKFLQQLAAEGIIKDYAGPILAHPYKGSQESRRKAKPTFSGKGKSNGQGALSGLRVLDMGNAIAGPVGPSFLADFGAEVIKLEMPGMGDTLRHVPPYINKVPLYWLVEGRNKLAVTLDLHKEEGQKILKDLVRICDVVIENYRPGTLEKWNLGYEELKKVNEKIILVRVTGFGQYGPYKGRLGYDAVGAAVGGIVYVTGEPDGYPIRPGMALCDYSTGIHNALAALIALYYRDALKTGKGQVIDLALYESISTFMGCQIAAFDKSINIGERTGNNYPEWAPASHFLTQDGQWLALVCPDDESFQRLAKAIGQENLLSSPQFRHMNNRIENAPVLNQIIQEWVRNKSLSQVLEILRQARVPACPIYSIKDIAQDPHFQERKDFIEVEDPVIGPVRMQNALPHFSLTPGQVKFAGANRMGQYNEEVFCGLLGYSSEKLEKLRQEKVI